MQMTSSRLDQTASAMQISMAVRTGLEYNNTRCKNKYGLEPRPKDTDARSRGQSTDKEGI